MKKLIVLAVGLFFLTISATAVASPPVPPPPEGFNITTETRINCIGDVVERQNFDWRYFSGTGAIGATGGANGIWDDGWQDGAELRYTQDFRAFGGETNFVKDFSATTDSEPNLDVFKLIGYTADADSNASLAIHEERVGLAVVSAGGDLGPNLSGLLSLCPWVVTGGQYPPTNEGIAAGSTFRVTELENFTTRSLVTSTDIPRLQYEVDAPYGVGTIEASFIVELWEGREGVGVWQGGAAPDLQSRTTYTEYARADGVWNFYKSVEYQSTFPELGSLNPFRDLF